MKKPTTTAKRVTTAPNKKSPSKKIPESASNAMVVAAVPAPKISRAQQVMVDLRNKQKMEKIEKWRAAGNIVNDPVQVARVTGFPINVDWTQEEMAYLLKVNPYIQSLSNLRSRADENNAKFLVPGRTEMAKIMTDVYSEYLKIETGEDTDLVYQQLKTIAKNTHEDTPNASLLVKVIFPDFNSKRVHMYSRAFEYAKQMSIPNSDYAAFVRREGGVEKIRSKAAKISAAAKKITDQTDLQSDAEIEKEQAARTNSLLEFQRTEPFLKIKLTSEQYSRMKPKSSVAKPGKDFEMVVLLAQMEIAGDKWQECNVYGTVPLTTELRKNIISTLGDHFIRDADFAVRYYAWLDAKNANGVAKVNSVQTNEVSAAAAIVATKVKPISKPKTKPKPKPKPKAKPKARTA